MSCTENGVRGKRQPLSGAVFSEGKGVPIRVLEPRDLVATGSVADPAFVLLHAGVPAELDALGREFIHGLLDALNLPAENGELYGLVLRPYPHNSQVGTRLRAEAEDKGERLIRNEAKPQYAFIEGTGGFGIDGGYESCWDRKVSGMLASIQALVRFGAGCKGSRSKLAKRDLHPNPATLFTPVSCPSMLQLAFGGNVPLLRHDRDSPHFGAPLDSSPADSARHP